MLLFVSLFAAATILVACGDGEEKPEEEVSAEADEEVEEETEEEPEEEVEEEPEEEEEEEVEEEPEEDTTEDTASESANLDFSELITFMEEETEGTATVLYENGNTQTHEMDGVTVSLDGYTVVELLDFHRNFDIPFDEQNNGVVVLAQYTLSNDRDDAIHYQTNFDMNYPGAEKIITHHYNLLPEDEQLYNMLSPANDYTLEAGDEIIGYVAYPFGEDRFEDVMVEGTVQVDISIPQTDFEDFDTRFGSSGVFNLPLDEESEESEAERAAQGFYEDRVTKDNMGEKEMLDSEEGIGESQELGDATVTLEGYQFTNFVPNEAEAPRFDGDEFVLLTVKFLIDNGYDEPIAKNPMSSTLTLNDGDQWTISEGMLMLYDGTELIEAGDSGELLQVFLLDQEYYEKIWKDKAFDIEIGPIYNEDYEDISKGNEVQFNLK
jgi:hypothetical protein